MMVKYECEQNAKKGGMEIFNNNKRFIPYHSERKGMEQMLKMLGVEYEYHYDEYLEVYGITVGTETVLKIR